NKRARSNSVRLCHLLFRVLILDWPSSIQHGLFGFCRATLHGGTARLSRGAQLLSNLELSCYGRGKASSTAVQQNMMRHAAIRTGSPESRGSGAERPCKLIFN